LQKLAGKRKIHMLYTRACCSPVKRYLQAHDMKELDHYVNALEKHADQNNAP